MMRAVSRVVGVLAVVVLALGITAIAVAGKSKPPATGDYQADLDINGTYQQGGWTVTKDGGKRVMIASTQYNGIYYPDPGDCDKYNIPINAESVPISKAGKFHVKESDPISGTDTVVKVDWKGKWKSATQVVGTIKLASGNCKSTNEFTGQKIAGS
jgi:hypothetical protein